MELRPNNRILGTTEDHDGCDCCGRMNLKVYVVIEHEDGTVAYYGTSCAAVMLKLDTAGVRKAAKAGDDAVRAAEVAARKAASDARAKVWFDFLTAEAGPGQVSEQIARLGGFAAASAAFKAAQL